MPERTSSIASIFIDESRERISVTARHDGQLSDVVTGQSGHGPVACLTLGESEASCCKSAVNRPVLIENLMHLE